MKVLLAVPLLAGLVFPPLVSAQIRIAPRSISTPAPAARGRFVPTLPPPDGGRFTHPFGTGLGSLPNQPAPFGNFGREFGRRHFHQNGLFFIDSLPFGYPYSYSYSPYALDFYPSLWPPLDQEYLQAWQIAHGDVAGEVASQQRNLLGSQVQTLSDEVESLRQKQASQPSAPQAAAPVKTLATVFVYRDGRVLQAHDYAIYGQKLWVFDGGLTRRIPLSALNLPATLQLNEQRGIDVNLPTSN